MCAQDSIVGFVLSLTSRTVWERLHLEERSSRCNKDADTSSPRRSIVRRQCVRFSDLEPEVLAQIESGAIAARF